MADYPIYLDYNATSPVLPQVCAAMAEIEGQPLNASSVHAQGRKAKQILEKSRTTIANHISAWPDEVIFTSGGTEANNMALRGISGRKLMVAASEHSSVIAIAKDVADATTLPVHSNGLLDMAALEKELIEYDGKALVSVMLVNNETGLIQPIKEIAKLVHAHGGLMHCDAVQALGKLSFDFTTLGVDMLTLGAHKVGGAIGAGALVVKNDVKLSPLLLGGGQEKRRRAGTENIVAIAGFAALIENLPDLSHLAKLREMVESKMLSISPNSKVMAKGAGRVANTISTITPNLSSELQLMHLDLEGICVSAGSACSSGRIEPSHVLQAMGYSKQEAGTAIRISMGWATTEIEVKAFLKTWQELVQKNSKILDKRLA